MLSRVLCVLIAFSSLASAQSDGESSLHRPDQLTVGLADQYLGQIRPDGSRLYFVSNQNTTTEMFTQDLVAGHATLLFDEGADVTWPRVSPDGKLLLYISYRDDAAGQLCVRALPDHGRRCLAAPSGALQAEWLDSKQVLLLARPSVEADLGVYRVAVGRSLSPERLLTRNLTGLSVSPDGKWLVYVPVARYAARIGPGFAARAATRLEAQRLDDLSAAPQPIRIDLPGLSGQPLFSRDGKSLYFVQFFDDSNHDGVIDAGDNGVLFRLPFETSKASAAVDAGDHQRSLPKQLTDASWSCQYPAEGPTQLLVTCARHGSLDVYSLPLEGSVPSGWTPERYRLELALGAPPAQQQLLYRQLLDRETDRTERRKIMMRLFRLHLAAEEFEGADYYVQHIHAERDPATRGVSRPLGLLVAHRRAVAAREKGRMSATFFDEERQRIDSLPSDAKTVATISAAALALNHIVVSEIADSLGDKARARTELETVVLDGLTVPSVLDLYYERAEALYRQLDDRAALMEVTRRLSMHPALTVDEQLGYARRSVRTRVRGLGYRDAEPLLATDLAAAPAGSELAFATELSQVLLGISAPKAGTAVDVSSLVALYRRQSRVDRRRALVVEAVGRATELGANGVVEALAQLYMEDAAKGTQEKRRAAFLFQQTIEGRAYRHLHDQQFAEAQADFDAVARYTASLDSYIAAIDLRFRAGKKAPEVEAEVRALDPKLTNGTLQLIRAYLAVRTLATLSGRAHEHASLEAETVLRSGWAELRKKRMAQALLGAILHERFLFSGERAVAELATLHYLIALDMVRSNLRHKATLLGQLALIQTQVGNYRIALGYLEERDELPFAENLSGLTQRMAKARVLLHIDREKDAAVAADEALSAVERAPRLKDLRPLALDRAALYNLAADRFERALALYDLELPLVDAAQGDKRNQLVVRLGHAAAALGAHQPERALADLALVDATLADPALSAALIWPHATNGEVVQAYRLIAAGLRANAALALDRPAEAVRALETRRALLKARADRTLVDEHQRALTLVEARLADVAIDRQAPAEAARWAAEALKHADENAARGGDAIDRQQLATLWLAATVAADGVKLPYPLADRLKTAHHKLAVTDDVTWRAYQRWFELYLPLVSNSVAATSK